MQKGAAAARRTPAAGPKAMVGRQGGLRVQLVAALVLLQTCTAINYYSELGVRRTASLADIKSAYRELARSNHPDKNKGADAQARFQRVAAAYETLSNPENRRQYDLYGDDYASIGRQAEQQRQFRSQYNDPFRRGRSRGPPIFSETLSLTSENHADLAEGQGETWLLQFYHDWSEPCKEFAPKWEALARKLPPMVRLARLNIDQNFGLLQRYRSFLRCRQTAFSLGVECTTPALVLVTPSVDGPPTGEAYHGALQAEHIYEWLKRSFASRPSAIREVHPTLPAIKNFLADVRDVRHRRRSDNARQPRAVVTKPKVLVMSNSPAAADTLFARFLGTRFSHLDIGTLHLAGGLTGASPAAQFAREAGVTDLPSLVAWPDGIDSLKPAILSVGSSSGAEEREELILSLQRIAVPSAPELTAANYFERCQPAADDAAGGLCVLLLVPALPTWSEATTRGYGTMRQLAMQGEGRVEGVKFAWLDSARHPGFADGVRAGHPPFRGHAAPEDEPLVVALRAASAKTGLRKVQVAHMSTGVSKLSEARLREWVEGLRSEAARAWGAARELPPLGGPVPPRVSSLFWVWMVNGGWLSIVVALGVITLMVFYGESIIKWAEELRSQPPTGGGTRQQTSPQGAGQQTQQSGAGQPRRPQPEPQAQERRQQQPDQSSATPDAQPQSTPASSSSSTSDASSSTGVPPGVIALTEHTIAGVLGGSANVLLFAVNAGRVDRATMDRLMGHFAERGRDGADALRGWTLAVLDISSSLRVEKKSPLLRSVLGRLQTSPCAVVRHARKMSSYSGAATPGRVEEWLDRLTMGELAWESLTSES